MHFLIITLGSHGDVHPFIGLARALKSLGHDVDLATNTHFQPLVERSGINFLALGEEADFLTGLKDKRVWGRYTGFKAIMRWLTPAHRKTFELIRDHHRPGETVLIGSTLAFGCRVAQDALDIPAVTVHLAPSIFRSLIDPPSLPGMFMPRWMPMVVKEKIWEGGDRFMLDPAIAPSVNPLRKELGLPPVERFLKDWWHAPGLTLGLFPDWYANPAADWPKQVRVTGFPMFDERGLSPLDPTLGNFLNAGTPPIAFTPGSAMLFGNRFFKVAAAACKKLGRRGLLLTRHAGQIPHDLPAGVIHVPYAPFSQLLPRCAALVHHGGIGTTSQALAAGIPQLIMAMSHDQPDNGARIKRLGVGDHLRPFFFRTPIVARKLDRLLTDPAVASACRATAARFEGIDSLADTAALIATFAAKALALTPVVAVR